ncbi:hypothetical protein PENSPDRAFT_670564 [Peniophora sp. CONT]|nr:hypothetical protein PENSPDRAFT_670564 [Peniophora sp. CONT]
MPALPTENSSNDVGGDPPDERAQTAGAIPTSASSPSVLGSQLSSSQSTPSLAVSSSSRSMVPTISPASMAAPEVPPAATSQRSMARQTSRTFGNLVWKNKSAAAADSSPVPPPTSKSGLTPSASLADVHDATEEEEDELPSPSPAQKRRAKGKQPAHKVSVPGFVDAPAKENAAERTTRQDANARTAISLAQDTRALLDTVNSDVTSSVGSLSTAVSQLLRSVAIQQDQYAQTQALLGRTATGMEGVQDSVRDLADSIRAASKRALVHGIDTVVPPDAPRAPLPKRARDHSPTTPASAGMDVDPDSPDLPLVDREVFTASHVVEVTDAEAQLGAATSVHHLQALAAAPVAASAFAQAPAPVSASAFAQQPAPVPAHAVASSFPPMSTPGALVV